MAANDIIALDTGAIIALAKDDSRARAWLKSWMRDNTDIIVPAPVLAEALRGGSSDAPVHRILNAIGNDVGTSAQAGRKAGARLGATNSKPERTMDALIVETALEHRATVIVTEDLSDIRSLLDNRARVIGI